MNWHEYFTYDQATGNLLWSERPRDHFKTENGWRCSMFCYAGKVAGSTATHGYITVRVNYKLYYAHRIIWEMLYGPIPEGMQVDHIDMDRANNRPGNMRLANNAQNNSNRGLQSNNTSGYKGVSWDKSKRKWAVQIKVGQKKIHLGRYDNIEEAVVVRQKATEYYHGQFARTV